MNIQKYRYKERFVTEYDVSEEIYPFCTVKLILQPILENAIYYGVGDMDEDCLLYTSGLQCVIKEVGINLALQGCQFTLSALILLFHNFLHQPFNLFI